MSALGQKQTCAVQNGMSALPLIAIVKADIAYGRKLLWSVTKEFDHARRRNPSRTHSRVPWNKGN